MIFALLQFLPETPHLATHPTSSSFSLSKKKRNIKNGNQTKKIPIRQNKTKTKETQQNYEICFVLANYSCAWPVLESG